MVDDGSRAAVAFRKGDCDYFGLKEGQFDYINGTVAAWLGGFDVTQLRDLVALDEGGRF